MSTYWLYVDPGSGSYLVQVIIAALLGAVFYLKSVWWSLKAFFKKWLSKKESQPPLHD